MNKRGSTDRPMLEISYIVFAVLVGLSVFILSFTFSKDTSFEAKVFAEDIVMTVETMQSLSADKIKVSYALPENFGFKIDENKVYVNDDKITVQLKYQKKPGEKITSERKGNILILEKHEV
ncbi:hypothetical protein HYX16_04530 [Candidatus Woesearchaeota archaeon]|nr:hypothetical protein [Candidatus Woesearchaeota archaeon]